MRGLAIALVLVYHTAGMGLPPGVAPSGLPEGCAEQAALHSAARSSPWPHLVDTLSPVGVLPSIPTKVDSQLGLTTHLAARLQGDSFLTALGYVDEGPNSGLYYYKSQPARTEHEYIINTVAFAPTSAWAGKHPQTRTNSVCGSTDDFPRIETLVEAHEAQHIAIYRVRFASEVGDLIERIVSSDGTSPIDQLVFQGHQAAQADTDAMDRDDRNQLIIGCTLIF